MVNACRRLVGLALALVSGCGPRPPEYRTTYSYSPPPDEHGRMCAMQCETSRSQCEQMARMRQDACVERARARDDECRHAASERYHACLDEQARTPGLLCIDQSYTCASAHCASDAGDCEGQYNRCFQVCGGRVEERRECVASCESAGPSRGY